MSLAGGVGRRQRPKDQLETAKKHVVLLSTEVAYNWKMQDIGWIPPKYMVYTDI